MVTAEPDGAAFVKAETVKVCGLLEPLMAETVTGKPPRLIVSGKSSAVTLDWVHSGPDDVATLRLVAPRLALLARVDPFDSYRPTVSTVVPVGAARVTTRHGS
jgi:hypothetical protein